MDEFHTLRAKLAVITSFRAIVGARPAAPITISKQASCNKAVSKGLRQGALHSSAICCFSATDKLSKLWTLLQAPGEAERMKHTRSLQTNGAIQRSSIRCWGNALAVASQHPSCDIDPTANPPNESKHFSQGHCHRGTWLPTCARTVRPFRPASRQAYSEEETPTLKWRAEEKHERTDAPIDFIDHLRQAQLGA